MSTLPSFEDSTTDSGSMPLDTRTVSAIDMSRMERKIDKVMDAINKLVVVEERVSNQSITIAEIKALHEKDKVALEKDIEANRLAIEKSDRKVEQWINRGIGAWVIAGVLFAAVDFFWKGH